MPHSIHSIHARRPEFSLLSNYNHYHQSTRPVLSSLKVQHLLDVDAEDSDLLLTASLSALLMLSPTILL